MSNFTSTTWMQWHQMPNGVTSFIGAGTLRKCELYDGGGP